MARSFVRKTGVRASRVPCASLAGVELQAVRLRLPPCTNTGSLVASGDTAALVLAAGVNLANGRADQPVSASGVLHRWGIGAAVAGSVGVTPGVPKQSSPDV